MNLSVSTSRTGALRKELRWFVRNRWVAGLMVVLIGCLGGYWFDWGSNQDRMPLNWSDESQWMILVGIGILIYNLVLWRLLFHKKKPDIQPHTLLGVAWAQLLFDFVALTVLTMLTGGTSSPVLGLFILHMVFAGILLPKRSSYIAAACAIVLVAIGLSVSGTWHNNDGEVQIMLGWMAMLILTVYLTNHITDTLRKSDTLLRRQHRQISAIVETAADGIISFGEDGKIISANTVAKRMFGFDSDSLEGVHIHLLMPIEYESLLHEAQQNIPPQNGNTGAPSRIQREITGRRADGSTFIGDAAVTVIHIGEKFLYTVIIRDMTEQISVERKLRALNEKLKVQQSAMIQHEKMVAVGRMAAGVAHEIANPLSNIDSIVQLALRRAKPLSEKQCDLIAEQVKRISTIIMHLKGFAHPEQTQNAVHSVGDLIKKSLSMIQFDRRHRHIELDDSIRNHCCDLRIQPQAVQQIFVNLLVNALDAVEGVDNPCVRISANPSNDGLCAIAFSDNGPGIPPENLKQVFDPFFTTKPVGQGTGLGLSICQHLVNKQGGRIEINSTPDSGTTVTVHLPIAPKLNEESINNSQSVAEPSQGTEP